MAISRTPKVPGTRPPRRRPRRRLDDVRRPQILETTVELIRERGLWEVRLSDVAERAGISATTVVYYFGTKDQLFAEAIHVADEGFYAPLAGASARQQSAAERLVLLMRHSAASDWPLWIDLWVYSRHHPETAAAQRHFHERWRMTIEEIVRYGCETGEWSVSDTAAVALRLSALTDGLAVHMVLGDSEHTPERYVEMSLVAAALELDVDRAVLAVAE
jgi:AcrR family transcriptional regulator